MQTQELKIDIGKSFRNSVCSFEVAKKIAEKGFTCANTFLAYDENGEIGDGGWLQKVTGAKMYPCVNLAMAYVVAENTSAELDKMALYQVCHNDKEPTFKLTYKDKVYEAERCADVLLLFWCDFKKD